MKLTKLLNERLSDPNYFEVRGTPKPFPMWVQKGERVRPEISPKFLDSIIHSAGNRVKDGELVYFNVTVSYMVWKGDPKELLRQIEEFKAEYREEYGMELHD